jgi:hypothetical protein
MTHLETLIAEYLEWDGYLIKKNTKVGKLSHGGWEMELDVVGFNPQTGKLVQYEPSIDALSWAKRESRYAKKFDAGSRYIMKHLFPWLPPYTKLEQIAVFINHPKGRDEIAGGRIMSIDELMAEIREKVMKCGPMRSNAIPEQYPLLRTIQMSHVGYHNAVPVAPNGEKLDKDLISQSETQDASNLTTR